MKKIICVFLLGVLFISCGKESKEEIIKKNFLFSRNIKISDKNIVLVLEMKMYGSSFIEMIKKNLVINCNGIEKLAAENDIENIKIIFEFPFTNKETGIDEFRNILEFDLDKNFCKEIMTNGKIPYNLIENMKNIKADVDVKVALKNIIYYQE